jgi:hypothetical protein
MNGVAHRFAAADESHDRFVAAISGPDAFRPNGPRYAQEESLFSFFVNALSTLECLHGPKAPDPSLYVKYCANRKQKTDRHPHAEPV